MKYTFKALPLAAFALSAALLFSSATPAYATLTLLHEDTALSVSHAEFTIRIGNDASGYPLGSFAGTLNNVPQWSGGGAVGGPEDIGLYIRHKTSVYCNYLKFANPAGSIVNGVEVNYPLAIRVNTSVYGTQNSFNSICD